MCGWLGVRFLPELRRKLNRPHKLSPISAGSDMLGVRYLKVPATTYVMQYHGDKVVREGAGVSFFYFAPTTILVQIPVSSIDLPFAFSEVSTDFQDVTVQGNLTFRVIEPKKLAGLLNYAVDARGRYQSEDPQKLPERLIQAVQTGARSFVQSRLLKQLLSSSDELMRGIVESLNLSTTLGQLGVEVLTVAVTSIKADPEMAKALQADAREKLLQQADEAIYVRRNAAIEQERTLRENELQTEIVVAQKRRKVRETEMEADIAVETQRGSLVQQRVTNERQEAEARGAALEMLLTPVRNVDWRVLMSMQGQIENGTLIASAFDQLAANASKIGTLQITPDLLQSLVAKKKS